MEKKPHLMAIVLFLTGLICIGLLFGLSCKTYQKIDAADQKMTSVIEPVKTKQKAMKEDIDLYTAKIEKKQEADKYLQQRSQTEQAVKNNTGEHERAPESENSQKSSKPSVFSEAGGEGFSDGGSDTTASAANGHIVGIDPGHQGENVDMSATEPNGPGSSTMKAKASTGTRGSYSGLPEYQLNLDVSLLLKNILEQRGYQVVMTRTDNDTAISNKERAELVRKSAYVFMQTVMILLLFPELLPCARPSRILMFPVSMTVPTGFPSALLIPIVQLPVFRTVELSTQIP